MFASTKVVLAAAGAASVALVREIMKMQKLKIVLKFTVTFKTIKINYNSLIFSTIFAQFRLNLILAKD